MRDKDLEKVVENIVKTLRETRLSKEISLAELSRMTGLHYTGISLIERGKRQPTMLSLLKIAKALEVNFEKIYETKV